MNSDESADATEYDISLTIETWERDGIRYRRVITRSGDTVIEKAESGRYVLEHKR
jgi:hypothetical protein